MEGGIHRYETTKGEATKNKSSIYLYNADSTGPYCNIREILRSNWCRFNDRSMRDEADSSPAS